MQHLLFALTLAAALGAGLMAGLFFAFSTFIMRALGHLPPANGIAAMQSINVAILNPLFLTVFFGTVVGSLLLANRLAAADPESTAGAEEWRRYLSVWDAWNHVRTVACLAAAAAFILAPP